MVKKVQYVNITPIPSHIPRQLAIDMLHSHGEIIELNPLVLEHHPIKAPRDAPADEFFSVWHEITERIQYIPGMGKMGSGKITFKGVFHDIALGLQTHIYAPAGVDMRNRYEIRGNQPGEPPEPRELGSGAPSEGLYLREEVEFKCNFSLAPFVKSQNKAAAKTMLERLVKKAELIDQEILRQMMEVHRNGGTTSQPQSPSYVQQPQTQQQTQQQQQQQPPYSPGTSPDYRRSAMLSNSEVLRQREEALRSSFRSSGSVRSSSSPRPSPAFQQPSSMVGMMGNMQQQQQQQQQQQPQSPPPPQQLQQQQQQQQPPGTTSQGLAVEMLGDTQYYPSNNTFASSSAPAPANYRAPPFGRQVSYTELDGSSQFGGSQASRHSSNGVENMASASLSSGWGGGGGENSDGPGSPRSQPSPTQAYVQAHGQPGPTSGQGHGQGQGQGQGLVQGPGPSGYRYRYA